MWLTILLMDVTLAKEAKLFNGGKLLGFRQGLLKASSAAPKPTVTAEQLVQNSTSAWLNAGSSSTWAAQQFTTTSAGTPYSVSLDNFAPAGPATGDVIYAIHTDNSGSPSTTAIATVTVAASSLGTSSVGLVEFVFDSTTGTCADATQYWIVAKGNTLSTANVNVDFAATDVYAGGTYKNSNNSGSTWSAPIAIDIAFQVKLV